MRRSSNVFSRMRIQSLLMWRPCSSDATRCSQQMTGPTRDPRLGPRQRRRALRRRALPHRAPRRPRLSSSIGRRRLVQQPPPRRPPLRRPPLRRLPSRLRRLLPPPRRRPQRRHPPRLPRMPRMPLLPLRVRRPRKLPPLGRRQPCRPVVYLGRQWRRGNQQPRLLRGWYRRVAPLRQRALLPHLPRPLLRPRPPRPRPPRPQPPRPQPPRPRRPRVRLSFQR